MKWIKQLRLKDNYLLLVLYIIMLLVSLQSKVEIFCGDGAGYYLYLPGAFIEKDFHHSAKHYPESSCHNDKNEVVSKYTCGTAYFFLPFFLAAHAWSLLFHLPADGYGLQYRKAILICSVTWVFFGIIFLKKLLSKYFNRASVWVTLIALLVGTNLYAYMTVFQTMSHIYSFSIVCVILFITDQYYEQPKTGKAILLAFLLGWLTLTRPTNILFLIFIIMYKITKLNDFKERIQFLRSRSPDLLIALPFFILPMIPQFLYWKEMFGKYVTYSYQDEGFIYWKQPKILEVLFDPQNGLFLYCPILLFLFYGLWIGRRQFKTNLPAFVFLFSAITYTFASWHCWFFAGAYGHRCYIDYLPVFAFPMCVAFEKIITSKRRFTKYASLFVFLLFIYLNIGFINIYKKELNWEGPEWNWNYDQWTGKVRQLF